MARLTSLQPRLARAGARLAQPVKTVDAFYESTGWRAFARRIKDQRGWMCEDCGKSCVRTPRELQADHVVERRDGGADFDETNIRLRCGACHLAKTNRARAGRPDRWRG